MVSYSCNQHGIVFGISGMWYGNTVKFIFHMVQIGAKIYSVTNDPVQCIIVVNQPRNQCLNPEE